MLAKLLFRYLGILLLCGGVTSRFAWASPLKITVGDYPPYISESMKGGGIFNTVVREAFASEGIAVEFIFSSWIRAFRMSEAGEADGSGGWYESEDRRKTHFYSEPVVMNHIVWFYLQGEEMAWKEFADLKDKKIVAIRGYTYNEKFYQAIGNGTLNVTFVNRLKQSFDLLLAGRMDLTLESVDHGYYMLRKTYPQSRMLFSTSAKPVLISPMYLLISKNTPDGATIIEKFNRGLNKLKQMGRINDLLLLGRTGKLD